MKYIAPCEGLLFSGGWGLTKLWGNLTEAHLYKTSVTQNEKRLKVPVDKKKKSINKSTKTWESDLHQTN